MMHTGTYFHNQSPSNPLSQMKYIYLSIPVAADKTMYLLVWHNSSLFILLEKVKLDKGIHHLRMKAYEILTLGMGEVSPGADFSVNHT